jgi:hypothetical protein
MRLFVVFAAATAIAMPVMRNRVPPPGAGDLAAGVTGTVYDSLGRRALSGATVQFTGAEGSVAGRVFSAMTDSAGRYALSDVPEGRYLAGFFHPVLDTIGLALGQVSVMIGSVNQVVPLATPSPRTLATALCPAGTFGDSLGMLIGHVRDTRTGLPLPGAVVTASWRETVIGRGGVRQREPEVAATADSTGWYGMCFLPGDVALTVRAVMREPAADSAGAVPSDMAGTVADSSGYIEVMVGGDAVRAIDFLVGGAHRVTVTAADTVVGRDVTPADTGLLYARRGTGQITGTVTNFRGEPAASARVLVWGAAMHATTGTQGTFRLDSVPGGTHLLEVRAIGFVPVRHIVHVRLEGPLPVTVTLSERAVSLPTVTVRGQLVYSRKLAAFEDRRRKSPFGTFFGPEDLESRPFTRITDVLSQVGGVQTGRPGQEAVLMRQNRVMYTPNDPDGVKLRATVCEPIFFVDGQRSFMTTAEIEAHYRSDEIAAIEVYTRESQFPIEYTTGQRGCGVIGLWTRPPPMRLRKR